MSLYSYKQLLEVANHVNAVVEAVGDKLALVLTTKDWLKDGYRYLVHDTEGAEVMDQLELPKKKTVAFTVRKLI